MRLGIPLTIALVAALCLQIAALALLRQGLHGTWLRRPFPLMIIGATLYHGLDEVLMLIPSIRASSAYRSGIPTAEIHWGAFLVSAGILATTVAYLLGLGERGRNERPDLSSIESAMRPLDWRLLGLLTVPLAAATYSGQGYNSGVALDSRTSSGVTVLASSFFMTLLILTTFSFVWKHGRRAFVPALAAQSILMAAAGQRLEIVIAAVVVCAMLATVGIHPSRQQVTMLAVVGGVCVLAITSVRTQGEGRGLFYADSGLAGRVDAIAGSLFDSPQTAGGDHSPGLLTQAALRMDSNEWAGGVAYSLEQGRPPLGLGAVVSSLRIAIPSALDPSKNDASLLERSSEAEQVWHFGLSPRDHIPGHFGLWLGLTGERLYLPVLMLFGWLFAKTERWTLRRMTTARLMFVVLLFLGAMFVERGIPTMLTYVRYGIPLGLLGWAAQALWPTLRVPRRSDRQPLGAVADVAADRPLRQRH